MCGTGLRTPHCNGVVTPEHGTLLRRVCTTCQQTRHTAQFLGETMDALLGPWQSAASVDQGIYICIIPDHFDRRTAQCFLVPARMEGERDEIRFSIIGRERDEVAKYCIASSETKYLLCPLCHQGVPDNHGCVPGMRRVCHACCEKHDVIEWQSTEAVKLYGLYMMVGEQGIHTGYIAKQPAIVMSQSPDPRILDP